jgi:hypothetical protein
VPAEPSYLQLKHCRLSPWRAALCRWQPLHRHAKIQLVVIQLVVTKLFWRDNKMKRFLFLALVLISSAAFAQDNTKLPNNKELVSKAHSFYVDSDTFYMKPEALQSSLLGRAEFKAWDLQITGRRDLADLVVRVHRIPFSNHFTYTVTERETATIVMAGKVDSLAGTVYGLIADEIVHKMKVLRGDPLAAQAMNTP